MALTVKEKAKMIADILDALENSHYLTFVNWQSRQKKSGGDIVYNPIDPAPKNFDRGGTFFSLVGFTDDQLRQIDKLCKK